MAKHEEFASEKLKALKEPEGYTPSAARARMQLELRRGERSRRTMWKVAFAAVMLVLFLAMPAAKAVAQTGTLSPEAYIQAVHGSLQEVHLFFYRLLQHF